MRDWRGSKGWRASSRHLGDKYAWASPVGGPEEVLPEEAAEARAAAADLLCGSRRGRYWECDHRHGPGAQQGRERAQSTQLGFGQEMGSEHRRVPKSQR